MELLIGTDDEILALPHLDLDVWIRRRPTPFSAEQDLALQYRAFGGAVVRDEWLKENIIRRDNLSFTTTIWNDVSDRKKLMLEFCVGVARSPVEAAEVSKAVCNEAFAQLSKFVEHNSIWKRRCYKYSVLFDYNSFGLPSEISISILLSTLAKHITVTMWVNIKQFVIRVPTCDEIFFFRQELCGNIHPIPDLSPDEYDQGFVTIVQHLGEFDCMRVRYGKLVKEFIREPRSGSVLKRVVEGIKHGLTGDQQLLSPAVQRTRNRSRRLSVPDLQVNCIATPRKLPDLVRNNSVRQIFEKGLSSPLISRCSSKFLRRRDRSSSGSRRSTPVQHSVNCTIDCASVVVPRVEKLFCFGQRGSRCADRECASCRKDLRSSTPSDYVH